MDCAEVDGCVTFAEDAGRGMRDDAVTWGARLDDAAERLDFALQWSLERADDPADAERGLRLATALHGHWLDRGRLDAGRSWLDRLLATAGAQVTSGARGRALNAAGLVAFRQGDRDEAHRRFEESLHLAKALGDVSVEVAATTNLARVALRDGDTRLVRALAARARERARALDDRAAEANPLHLLAAGTRMAGELDAAERLYRESLELNRNLGRESMVTTELLNLGSVEKRRGHAGEAARLFGEALERAIAARSEYTTGPVVLGLAGVAALLGEYERAARLLGGARALYATAGLVADPDDEEEDAWTVTTIRNAIGDAACKHAVEIGRTLPRADILRDAAAVAQRTPR